MRGAFGRIVTVSSLRLSRNLQTRITFCSTHGTLGSAKLHLHSHATEMGVKEKPRPFGSGQARCLAVHRSVYRKFSTGAIQRMP